MTTALSVHPSFTKPDVHDRVNALEDELRDIHNNTNEGPRLLAELVERELPKVVSIVCDCEKIDQLETELDEVKGELRDADSQISELEARIEALESDLRDADSQISELEARIEALESDEDE